MGGGEGGESHGSVRKPQLSKRRESQIRIERMFVCLPAKRFAARPKQLHGNLALLTTVQLIESRRVDGCAGESPLNRKRQWSERS